MSLLKRYLFIRPKENIDAIRNTVLPNLNSIVANLVNKSLANTSRQLQGLQLYFISLDKPLAFTYNNELMIKGSELLKLPLLYTSRGRIDTRYAGIEPELYYRIGNDGSFDNTHYLNFTNEDTYTPIDLDKLQYVLNQAFIRNNEFGSINEQKRLGQITPVITNNDREIPSEFKRDFDPYNNAILNKAVNGLDPDEALYDFWDGFVYNTPSSNTLNNLNINYT